MMNNFGIGSDDPLFAEARERVLAKRTPSVSYLQRAFRLGYSRACALMSAMEGDVVTAPDQYGVRYLISANVPKGHEP